MRKLYLNQKLWSVREKFAVVDAQGHPVYRAVGSLMKLPKQFTVLDLNDQVVAKVTKRPLTWLARFELEIDGKHVATIQKKLSLWRPHYELTAAGITVTGDFWDMNFTIQRHGQPVGQVAKRWFSVGDKYELTIMNPADERLMVGLVLAIDYVKRLATIAANQAANGSV